MTGSCSRLRVRICPRSPARVGLRPSIKREQVESLHELDPFWPKEGLAIEIDGYTYHASRPRIEGDRRKDAWLRGRGIEVIRLTWRQITRDATATAVLVGRALALASARRLPVEGEGDRS